MVFSIFTKLCEQHHNLILDFFHLPPEKLHISCPFSFPLGLAPTPGESTLLCP